MVGSNGEATDITRVAGIYKRRVSFFSDSAACACAMGGIIPFHVPLAPPGIGKAGGRSHPPIRMAEGARMKRICFLLS